MAKVPSLTGAADTLNAINEMTMNELKSFIKTPLKITNETRSLQFGVREMVGQPLLRRAAFTVHDQVATRHPK
jgi:hypothetical protein